MLLIRSALVVLSGSTYNGKTVDIFIENGRVKRIGAKLKNTENALEVSYPNLHIAPGFVDMHAYIGEPGYEQKETIATACKSAAKGGITQFCVMPNLNPASDNQIPNRIFKTESETDKHARLLTYWSTYTPLGRKRFSRSISICIKPGQLLSAMDIKPYRMRECVRTRFVVHFSL
jgi:dihydroorotase-like cyclic amidohydrolase